MELFKASNQWATRPPDERFASLDLARDACLDYRKSAQTATISHDSIRVEADGDELRLAGHTTDKMADLTSWAFGQVCNIAQAPTSYLKRIKSTLAAQCINYGLKRNATRDRSKLLFHPRNGEGLLLRAITSTQYQRFWNHEVFERLIAMSSREPWKVPPAMGNKPSGLYASSHDMFAFMVNDENRINDGSEGGLGRGFFLWNSEVGAKSLGGMTFLYRYVCGNHIVWGAQKVMDFRLKHTKNIASRAAGKFRDMEVRVRQYAESSASDLEAKIASSKTLQIADSEEGVIDALFSKGVTSRVNARAGFKLAEKHSDVDGSPWSQWGMLQGLTRASQEVTFADERAELDLAAAKVMEIQW
ncbi:MAG: hypothetical protein BMS9Abin37_2048 [Acidobacteriota bacterium]|nr:MAG: hypothetical protein BMS9Abin37_2048 [Acidobacteriota bacterium]